LRKYFFVVIILYILFSFAGFAQAAPQVVLDGQTLGFDVQPTIENGRTLVPLRTIFEALGAEVNWDDTTQTVTAKKDHTELKLVIGGQAFKNGAPVHLDVPAQVIDGRTMIPARFVAEALGANVGWDEAANSVLITTSSAPVSSTPAGPAGLSRANPLPAGQSLITQDGLQISVKGCIQGTEAWKMVKNVNTSNEPPEDGKKYILISINVKNISGKKSPLVNSYDFQLEGRLDENEVFRSYQASVELPDSGRFKELYGEIYNGKEITGGICFYVPANESSFVLKWLKPSDPANWRYFEVK